MLVGYGLSDKQQAILTFISLILIGLGSAQVPGNLPSYVYVIIFLAGALGMALKEALGTIQPTVPVVSPTAPATQNYQPDPNFNVNDAKTAGFSVFLDLNIKGGYALFANGTWLDAYGEHLGTTQPVGLGQQL